MKRDEQLRERRYVGTPPPPAPTFDDDPDDGEVVDVRDERRVARDDVRVPHGHDADEGIALARDRFGGFDLPAQLTGMLVALAMLVLLGGIAGAAIGTIAYQTGLERSVDELSIGSLVTGLVVLFLAFLIGGWAAGRIARYDGGRNGLMTAVWFIILGAMLAGLGIWLGAEYNVVGRVELPNWFDTWFSQDEVTTAAAISGIVAIVVTLIGGFLGGLWGVRIHRRADDVIARAAGNHDVTTTRRRAIDDDRMRT
jgi:hypothetical protein